MYLPFYDSRDVSSPEAELDAMKFVLWLSFVAERAGCILNPTDASIAEMAGTLLNHWNSKKQDQPKFPVHALLILNNVVSLPHEGRRYDMGVSSQGFEGSV